jgi:hypothetical protein
MIFELRREFMLKVSHWWFESSISPKNVASGPEQVVRAIPSGLPKQVLLTCSAGLQSAQSPAPHGAFCTLTRVTGTIPESRRKPPFVSPPHD